MNIIFGDAVNQIPDSYTILELDTIKIRPGDHEFKTWCVIETIPLPEFPMLESLKKIHSDLLDQYRKQNWEFCEQAIESLMGKFGGELDSFYSEISRRVIEYKQNPPGSDWDWSITKIVKGLNTQ